MSEHKYLTEEEELQAEALCNETWIGNVAHRFRCDLASLRAELKAAREERDRAVSNHFEEHGRQCDNCSVIIVTKGGDFGTHGLSQPPEGSEDESLCGACAGAQMYIESERADRAEDELDRMRTALEAIRQHQQIVAGSAARMSTAWIIANNALNPRAAQPEKA